VVERHEREHHPDGHDQKPDGDGQHEEPSQTGLRVHGGESFAQFVPQIGLALRALGVRNADEEQRRAGDQRPHDIEQQDVADRGEPQQQGSQCRSCQVRE